MADDVCEVCLKFDQRCSKSIAEDHNDHGGFDDVHMACNLIEMCIWTCQRYHDVVQGRLRKIELD
jgi:hypothetical protein